MLDRRLPTTLERSPSLAWRLGGWSLALLAALLPFEPAAGGSVAGLTWTIVELALLAALAAWVVTLILEARWPRVAGFARVIVLLAGGLLLALGISALLAPEWRGEALKFTARQALGASLMLALMDQLATQGRHLLRLLGVALVAGATASAAVGLLELSVPAVVLPLLGAFKQQPTTVGGLLRLSGTFGYANIAAMYYEATLPIALAGVALAQRRAWQLAAAACAAILFLAALLTYSRAALVTAPLCVVLMLGAAWLRRGEPGTRAVALCGVALVVLAGVLWAGSPAFRLRVAEPDVDRWYRASYVAAAPAELATGERARVAVRVRNDGLITWRSDGIRPVVLSYHWLDAATGDVVRWNGLRTALPAPVPPGASADLLAYVEAPERPGRFILAWDMVEENSAWFSDRGNPTADQAVAVQGAPAAQRSAPAAEPGSPPRLAATPPPPARSKLWAAALQIWGERPLLGIGPDVFRHVYGPRLGLAVWDDRVHTNSLYLELLVGAGAVGLALLLALLVATGSSALRALVGAERVGMEWWATLGCLVALTAYAVHGVLDVFLEFSATYLLFWGLIGAVAALVTTGERQIRAALALR